MKKLTPTQRAAIRTLNYVATFDGIIDSEADIEYLLVTGIEKFIPKSKRHLVGVNTNRYPMRIEVTKQ